MHEIYEFREKIFNLQQFNCFHFRLFHANNFTIFRETSSAVDFFFDVFPFALKFKILIF